MKGSDIASGVWADIQELISIHARLGQASSEDEREDILVDLQVLRGRSTAVSILCSIVDMHHAHPMLLPLLGAGLALRYLF